MLRRLAFAVSMAATALSGGALACDNPAKQMAMLDAIRGGQLHLQPPVPELVTVTPFVREDGTLASLQDLKGKPSIVSFWYPECSGCQTELPSLNALLGEFGDRDDINLLSISIRGSLDHVKGFLDRNGYDNVEAHLDEDSRIFAENCLLATPTHLILNREARIVEILIGAQQWDAPEVKDAIEKMIAES